MCSAPPPPLTQKINIDKYWVVLPHTFFVGCFCGLSLSTNATLEATAWPVWQEKYVHTVLTPVSQVEVGCPWARGLQPQYTPRQKNTHRPTKRNATLLERHATPRKLRVQRKHNVGTWPPHAPKRHTAGQETAPMLTNNSKRYKRKHSHAQRYALLNALPKNAQNTRDHSS